MYTYYSSEEHFLRIILMIYFFVIIAGLAAGIVRYILKSIGMYRIARNRNMDNAWLAWVPYARTYLQGELSGVVSFGRQKIKNPGLWMILIPLVSGFILIILNAMIIFSVITDGMYYVNGVTSLISGFLVFLVILVVLLAAVAGIAVKVLRVFVNRQIFEALTSESMALFHAVASVFVPLYEDICFFVLRDKGSYAEYEDTQRYSRNPYQESTGYLYQSVQTDTPQKTEAADDVKAEKTPETEDTSAEVLPIQPSDESNAAEEQKPSDQKAEDQIPEDQKPEDQKPAE